MKWINSADLAVPYYTFENIEHSSAAICGFTTRIYRKDGAEDDFFQPLLRADSDPAAVAACRKLLSDQFGADPERVVRSAQKHTANIHKVTESDLGPAGNRNDFESIDGLITDLPGVMLQTFGADCPSVYLLDPEHRAIGLCHSGRKGTQYHIAGKMLEQMTLEYGTDPGTVLAAISPGICMDCYEVGDDVAQEFLRDYHQWEDLPEPAVIMNGRYHLDLNAAIAGTLMKKGVPVSQIETSGLCTRCRNDRFYSFRAQGCITNENCAFLMLKDRSK